MPSIYALFIFNWGFSIIILSHALQSVFILLYLPCLKSFSLAFFFLLVFCRNPSQTSFSEKVKTSSKWWYHVSKVIHCCPGCARWDSLTSLYLWCSYLERASAFDTDHEFLHEPGPCGCRLLIYGLAHYLSFWVFLNTEIYFSLTRQDSCVGLS